MSASTTDLPGESRVYVPLDKSAYRVTSPSVRERYWFSGGATLNQGQTSAVVGIVWTHWLADRGVQLPGVTFDETYARALFEESQRVAGIGDGGGSYLWAGAQVLQSRGLVEECFSCPDADTVVNALADRGPIVIGLSWHDSLSTPEKTGDHWVCRLKARSTVVGGHALLLNGVALDLDLNGTSGFVRFKNSWGTEWGDHGQCLISIADLSKLMAESSPTALLPIPAASSLAARSRQDFAIPEDAGLVAELVRYQQESIRSDVWTTRDTVGYAAYADAIARGIQHPDTRPPLTIGIKAPWGAGKTSLMRMIRDRLEWPTGDMAALNTEKLRKIRLTQSSVDLLAKDGSGLGDRMTHGSGSTPALQRIRTRLWTPIAAPVTGISRRRKARLAEAPIGSATLAAPSAADSELRQVTNGMVLRSARSARGTAADSADGSADAPERTEHVRARPRAAVKEPAASHDDELRWRPTVWFNPWAYQTGEQVWAGLAHDIISGITDRMSVAEREHFWLRLNRRRIDEHAVRSKVYSLIIGRAVPFAVAAVVLLAAGLATLILGGPKWVGSLLVGGSPALMVATVGLQAVNVLKTNVSGSLSRLVEPTTGLRHAVGAQLNGAYEELVRSPDYKAESGFLYLVQSDLRDVLDLVATEERPLVVFVDDLDRCSPSMVVHVIEAINVFLAGNFANAIFVIAMEPQMVAAHVEAAYSDLVVKLRETTGQSAATIDLGWKFLEKIVQLPLTLPAMVDDQTQTFFRSLFRAQGVDVPVAEVDEGTEEPAEPQPEADSLHASLQLAGAAQATATPAGREAVRNIVDRQLSLDNPEVQAVITYGAKMLDANPREIKRFVNVFRFLVMIHTERRIQQLPTPASLEGLAKLAVLSTRWPSLIAALTEPRFTANDMSALQLLEEPPTTRARKGETLATAQTRVLQERLSAMGLGQPTIDRLLTAELRRFLEAEPKVGRHAQGYL